MKKGWGLKITSGAGNGNGQLLAAGSKARISFICISIAGHSSSFQKKRSPAMRNMKPENYSTGILPGARKHIKQKGLQFFYHQVVRQVHFRETFTDNFISQFFIESDGAVARMHHYPVIALIPCQVFGKIHDRCAYAFSL